MLHRNLTLKAASLLLAVFLWFWVMLNEENPLTQRTIEVAIAPQGIRAGLAYEFTAQAVKVTLRGLERDMVDLKGQVNAAIACNGLGPGTYRLGVKVIAPEGVALVAVRPQTVSLLLEGIVSESKPVEVKLVGEPIGGFDVKSADYSPKQVQVSGARSRVDRTAQVVVTADLARMVPGVPVPTEAHALDGSGTPVEGVTLAPARVNVTAVTERVVVTKTLPVIPRTHGVLPREVRLVSVQVDPPMVTLVLPAARGEAVSYIESEELNLTNVRRTVTRNIKLVVPAGASLVDSEQVNVTLQVEPAPVEPRPSAPQQPEEAP